MGAPILESDSDVSFGENMKTHVFVMVLVAMLLHCACASATEPEKQYPEITRAGTTKGQDIKPFCVTSKKLASILRDLKKEPSRKAMADIKGIFRKYAMLPPDYEGLLASFSNRTQPGRYDIAVGSWGTLHVRVDQTSRIVKEQYSSISGSSPHANTPVLANSLSDAQACELLHNIMSLKGRKMEQFTIVASHFGQHTLLLSAYLEFISPSIRTTYVVDRRIGKIRETSLESLSWAMGTEFPTLKTEDDYMALMKTFIRLSARHGADIISGVADIKQYEDQKLDSDVEAALRSPFKTSDKRHPIVYVCYTYQRIGGVVERYRFPFGPDGRLDTPSRVLLGRDIGAAQYLE